MKQHLTPQQPAKPIELVFVVMKKALILLAAICCCGCSSVETKATSTTETPIIKFYRNDVGVCIYTVEVEGHLYIIFGASHGGGIVHAEHCPCKMK